MAGTHDTLKMEDRDGHQALRWMWMLLGQANRPKHQHTAV